MTRFARAKGSKASNERVPEDATSWSDMKQQLLEKNKHAEEAKKKQAADKQREKNYKAFLQNVEEEQSKESKWAEFPTEKPTKSKKIEKNNNESITKVKKKEKKKKNPPEAAENVEKVQKKSKKGGVKRKNDAKSTEAPAVKKAKKSVELNEEDLKKIEKKKQKKLRQSEKRKLKKPPENNKIHNRRKQQIDRMFINGKEVDIAYVDGFPIKKEDAERIHQLRRQMIGKGLPRSEIKIALKLERRKAEKAFAREKKKVCFNCRKSGHNLSECPDLGRQQLAESAGTGICFKCGSTEHTHFECKVVRGEEFKFAQCFICREQGHIARQCPDNARGLYPKGGACNMCGDVTHLKKDCPKYQAQQRQLEESVQLETFTEGDNPDSLGKNEDTDGRKEAKRPNKIIKF